MAVDYSGTWKLYDQENAEEFLRAICELQQNKSLCLLLEMFFMCVCIMFDVFIDSCSSSVF